MSTERLTAALEALEKEEAALAAELTSLQLREREVIDRLAELRDAIGPVKKLVNGRTAFALGQPQEVSFAGLVISEAIDKLLTMLHKPMSAPEISRELLARGFKTESQNFTNLVGATLRRLEGKRFRREGDNGWTYLL